MSRIMHEESAVPLLVFLIHGLGSVRSSGVGWRLLALSCDLGFFPGFRVCVWVPELSSAVWVLPSCLDSAKPPS